MKKSRFISALTSVAMTAGLLISAMPIGVSASELISKSSTTALKLGAEKTSFTMEEVAAGNAKTTVSMYADSFNDDEKITTIIGGFAASADGITIGKIDLPDNMGLTTVSKLGDDKAASPKRRFKQAAANDTNHNFVIAADATNPIVLENAERPIVTFDVEFASNMAAGTYTINFDNPTTPLEVQSGYEFRTEAEIASSGVASGTLISVYTDAVRANSKGVDIVLGGTPSTDPTPPVPTGDNKKYDGNIKIWAEDVVGEPGKNVKVDVYADTAGGEVAAVELKPVWDTSAFELVGMKEGYGLDGLPTLNVKTGAYVIAQADDERIPNDPTEPIVTLEFKPTGAKEGTKYPISFEGTNGSKEVLAMKSKGKTTADDVYYKVNLTNGSITLKSAGTTEEPGLKYDGKIKIWADKVTAAAGDTVEVNVYADTNSDDIAALELKPVFDSKHLTLTAMKEGYGLDGMPTLNVKTGAYVIAQADEEKIPNDPSEPIVTLTFKVSDDAAPGDEYEISFSGTNGSANILAMKNKGKTTADDTYLEVTTDNGSVKIKDAPKTTVATTTQPAPTTVSVVTSIETTISLVTTESVVTTISVVTSVETTISLVTTESVVTTISLVTTESVVTTISVVTSVETTISVVTTQIIVTVTEPPTTPPATTTVASTPATTTTAATTTQAEIKVVVPDKTVVDQNSLYWYHSDNKMFFRDGIIVLDVGGEEPVTVTDAASVKFDKTPAEVYDGKTFDYEVDFVVTYQDQEIAGKLPVKIGLRGDADLKNSDKAGLQDIIAIAKSQLPSGKKLDPKTFVGYLADVDENDAVNLHDIIAIAKYQLPSYKSSWTNIIKDYDKKILD